MDEEVCKQSSECNHLPRNRCGGEKSGVCKMNSRSESTAGKHKTRASRRRLNALMNNASIHFSDTDSEGELSSVKPSMPIISVTLDGGGSEYTAQDEGPGIAEVLTDIDDITSEPDEMESAKKKKKKGLEVKENNIQGETDLEDFSNDEEETQAPIHVRKRADILRDFHGETVMSREGDGPFSAAIRTQMSLDDPTVEPDDDATEVQLPMTDTEDMEASDDEVLQDGAYGLQPALEDIDFLASAIVSKNVNKMSNTLGVKEDICDALTDTEDIE